MILDVKTSKGVAAITSDHWHIVHSRLIEGGGKRPFSRIVHSEHADARACRKAARELRLKLATEAAGVPLEEQDEVFVRRPNFKSLKHARARRKSAS
jgi:hypothetical protein